MDITVPSLPFLVRENDRKGYAGLLNSEPKERQDSLLSKRLKRRDEAALEEVYALYSRPVFGFLMRLIGDRPAAEDVQQEVFMELWQKADRFDPDRGTLLSWLMTIARSRAIDQSRRRVPEPRNPVDVWNLADSDSDSDSEIDQLVGAWQFTQLLDQLPEEQAKLLKFRFRSELTQAEISTKTGIPLGTVKSRMVSALERLREMMEKES